MTRRLCGDILCVSHWYFRLFQIPQGSLRVLMPWSLVPEESILGKRPFNDATTTSSVGYLSTNESIPFFDSRNFTPESRFPASCSYRVIATLHGRNNPNRHVAPLTSWCFRLHNYISRKVDNKLLVYTLIICGCNIIISLFTVSVYRTDIGSHSPERITFKNVLLLFIILPFTFPKFSGGCYNNCVRVRGFNVFFESGCRFVQHKQRFRSSFVFYAAFATDGDCKYTKFNMISSNSLSSRYACIRLILINNACIESM